MTNSKKPTSYVCEIDQQQANTLSEILERKCWNFKEAPYAHWQASLDKTTVTAYQSGKLTIQGRGTEELVLFVIEPEILKKASWGYESSSVQVEEVRPEEPFRPHAGIDESGKGDFFGPLVVACVYVDESTREALEKSGVKDSKAIKSDARIFKIAEIIRKTVKGRYSVVAIGPEAYNRLYDKMRSLNRMLAWGHARALENLLEKVPDCQMALADKFGDEKLIQNALMKSGDEIELIQKTKAESDIAVAAASILARAEFVRRMEKLGEPLDLVIPKGASAKVEEVARGILSKHGEAQLRNMVKAHFKTLDKVLQSA